jgi:hypothetical protein
VQSPDALCLLEFGRLIQAFGWHRFLAGIPGDLRENQSNMWGDWPSIGNGSGQASLWTLEKMGSFSLNLRSYQVTNIRIIGLLALNLSATACSDGASSNTADAGADVLAALDPVRVIRGAATQSAWWDLAIKGGNLQPYEGATVTVRIGSPDRPPERLGSGQTRIENGEFSLLFPQVWEAGLYKLKQVWIDVDRNGTCNSATDLFFSDARAHFMPDLYVGDVGPLNARFGLDSASDPKDPCLVFTTRWPSK